MIKGSEAKNIEAIGTLQAALTALQSIELPRNSIARNMQVEAINYTRKALLRQWESNDQYISEDDT